MSRDKQISLRLILNNSKDVEAKFFSIHSEADVDHLISERIAYATNQASYEPGKFDTCLVQNFENSESIDIDTGLTQNCDPGWARDSQKITEIIDISEISGDSEEEVQSLSTDESITVDSQDELDLWEPEHIPYAVIRFAEGHILEESMLEEEIEFQI